MRNTSKLGLALLVSFASVAMAQDNSGKAASAPDKTDTSTVAKKTVNLYRPLDISHMRPADMRGLNVFESPKEDLVPFNGFVLSFGGAFNQEFQGLQHTNTAQAVMVTPAAGGAQVNNNQLINIGHGFNNAVANLNVNAQLAPGIRVAMTSYLSARHHQESWVKDGYVLVDESPIDNALLKSIMKYTTLRVGHFEINYGDSHFRRTDNGNAMFNPFVGNYVLDVFTTEIGAEVYERSGPFLGMLGITGGEIHGQVANPGGKSIGTLGKVGFDQSLGNDLRFRLTGSFYANNKAISSTLFTGDRGGSMYYDVLENGQSTETANAWSGQVRPGFSNKINAEVINPFIKIGGAEFFGDFQIAKGGAFSEPKLRNLRQQVYEGLYRFADDKVYLGGRYNVLSGQLISKNYNDQSVNRWQLGGGWFVTPNILTKAEWVNQKYNDFPVNDIRNGGNFKGFMFTGAVAF